MELVKTVIGISPTTYKSMQRLAEITGLKGGVSELMTDAVRAYEWIVFQQMSNRLVGSIPGTPELIEFLKKHGAELIAPIIDSDRLRDAREYFDKQD